jgi:hypothetical protein
LHLFNALANADGRLMVLILGETFLKVRCRSQMICIGKRIEQVQKLFAERYGVPEEEYKGVFDKLFDMRLPMQMGGLWS